MADIGKLVDMLKTLKEICVLSFQHSLTVSYETERQIERSPDIAMSHNSAVNFLSGNCFSFDFVICCVHVFTSRLSFIQYPVNLVVNNDMTEVISKPQMKH